MTEICNRRTPLYDFHKNHNAHFITFAGWDMPARYTSVLKEHQAVRNAAGLFDISHMGRMWIHGPDAIDFLNHITTYELHKLPTGKACYTLICYHNGGIVDDIIVYRMDHTTFFLCLNATNFDRTIDWIQSNIKPFNCHLKAASHELCQLALQGPAAASIISLLTDKKSENINRFEFLRLPILHEESIISRTGYTGEDGFEIYCTPSTVVAICEELLVIGQSKGLLMAGLSARDSLRMEAGYPLYGHEISETITPSQSNLNWAVKFDKKSSFIGDKALILGRNIDSNKHIIFFKIDGARIARQSCKVYQNDKEVGEVVSGMYSPTLCRPIGSAMIRLPRHEIGPLTVDIRGKKVLMECITPPFFTKQREVDAVQESKIIRSLDIAQS